MVDLEAWLEDANRLNLGRGRACELPCGSGSSESFTLCNPAATKEPTIVGT